MRVFYGSRLSDNMTLTPEGYLICLNVPIARTGSQQYLRSELGLLDGDTNSIVDVMRTEAEVFAPATIASFEGKPVTDDHPPVSVTAENIVAYGNGHAQNIRRGTGEESDLLLADLVINAPKLIQEIQNGRREISCGYDCEYMQDEQGRLYQSSIRGNHVAVVPAGRAGHRVAIKDSDESKHSKNEERGKPKMANTKNNPSFIARLFSRAVKDMEPDEVAEAVDEIQQAAAAADETPATPAAAATDNNAQQQAGDNDPMTKLLDAIAGLSQKMDSVIAASKPQDQEPAQKPVDNDPLAALVAEIAENAAETPADQEASATIPADELHDEDNTQDEDGPVAAAETLPENPIPGADCAMALAAINAIKPVLATLPEKQRKAASDRAATEIRKMLGKDSKPASNGYAGIVGTMTQAAKSRAKDSKAKKMDDGTIGRNIMASRNPHYKKS